MTIETEDVVARLAKALDALGERVFALPTPLEERPGTGGMSSPSMRPSITGDETRANLVAAFQLVDCLFSELEEAALSERIAVLEGAVELADAHLTNAAAFAEGLGWLAVADEKREIAAQVRASLTSPD